MTLPLSLLATHFVGDFLLQSDQMALNKSKSDRWLLLHVLVYAACFLLWGWRFALVTFVLHLLTDCVTSRITSRLWFVVPAGNSGHFTYAPGNRRHWFFVAIGADQLLHYVALALTWRLWQ